MNDLKIVENNIEKVLTEMEAKKYRTLTILGMKCEKYAKGLCPVDTGNLRNSITHKVILNDELVYVGTNVEYAPYVELGTKKTKPKPYLRPAVENHMSEYKSIIDSEMKKPYY